MLCGKTITMNFPRASGILLHPTSLPGDFGIGDVGPKAYEFVDLLAEAKQTYWQILPLGHTGYGDSPYQCFSAFAGNPWLISPDALLQDGLIQQADLHGIHFPDERVDSAGVIPFKDRLLTRAWENFNRGAAGFLTADFERFCRERSGWLTDYALFMAIKEKHGGGTWT